jgi:hypothetical protein
MKKESAEVIRQIVQSRYAQAARGGECVRSAGNDADRG